MRPPLQAACHDLYWTVEELGSKIIVDLDEDRGSPLGLGVNALICELEGQGRFTKVVESQYALASLHCTLRISVAPGNCPPLEPPTDASTTSSVHQVR